MKPLSLLGRMHARHVFTRRVEILAAELADHMPEDAEVLDIGCGNGLIDATIMRRNPGVSIRGIEVRMRPECLVDCQVFDGVRIPFEDESVDLCMFVDVLHHTHTIRELLVEAHRVSRKYVLIKDHLCESLMDAIILKAMDWVGNRPHGVSLVYNYRSQKQWEDCFRDTGLRLVRGKRNLHLYPYPADLIFGRGLHFISLLEKFPANAVQEE